MFDASSLGNEVARLQKLFLVWVARNRSLRKTVRAENHESPVGIETFHCLLNPRCQSLDEGRHRTPSLDKVQAHLGRISVAGFKSFCLVGAYASSRKMRGENDPNCVRYSTNRHLFDCICDEWRCVLGGDVESGID